MHQRFQRELKKVHKGSREKWKLVTDSQVWTAFSDICKRDIGDSLRRGHERPEKPPVKNWKLLCGVVFELDLKNSVLFQGFK